MSENDSVAKKLTRRQQKAIVALLTEGTMGAAAKKAGIGERQLYRWKNDPVFVEALQQASDETLDATVRALTNASTTAAKVLLEIAEDPLASRPVKVRAADVILGHMLKVKDNAETERRMAEIERRLNALD